MLMLVARKYQGRRAVLTTMHGKGAAIAAPLHNKLGLKVEVNAGINTDVLGTFTREVARENSMLETAIEKARLGMNQSRQSLGIASEGSFGPHPSIPFLAVNRELTVFVDDERRIVVHELVITEDTNFSNAVVLPDEDVSEFLGRVGFPEHAVVISPHLSADCRPTFKGVRERTVLNGLIRRCADASSDGKVLLQTDMRANFNPTRMKVIATCADKLADRLRSECPECLEVGWGIVDLERGLPCEFCGAPTKAVKFEIWGCVRCTYREKRFRLDGMSSSEQQYCDSCNP
jgi:hypothetical protein